MPLQNAHVAVVLPPAGFLLVAGFRFAVAVVIVLLTFPAVGLDRPYAERGLFRNSLVSMFFLHVPGI